MDKYKLTFGIEPTDKYNKAKQDLIQALKSLQELSPQEQRVLIEELFGAAQVAIAINMFNKYLGRWNNVQFIKDILEIIYYIAFIVLTWLIVKYSIKTYKLQSSKESKLLCKIFISEANVENGVFPFYLEIYNFGNIVARDIDVFVLENKIATVDFIKPNESYYFPLGNVYQMIACNRIFLLDDESEIENNANILVELKTKGLTSTFKLNTNILFASRRKVESDSSEIADAIKNVATVIEKLK